MEYQYYEFQAIDRPLNAEEQAYVSKLSSRVELTPRQAIFTYSYGDFRGNPLDLLAYCFDALFYQANWGTTQLAFRFPASAIDLHRIEPYCIGESIDIVTQGDYTILNIAITDEEMMGRIEPEGALTPLLPLRDALLQGDLRLLYIAWLKAAQHDESLDLDDAGYPLLEADADLDMHNPPEPPVPPNLQTLSAPLQYFIEIFTIDPDLVACAAEASPAHAAPSDQFDRWVPLLPDAERQTFLVRLAQGDPHVRMDLVRRLREVGGTDTALPAGSAGQRTLNELIKGARDHARRRKAREQQVATQARQRELEALAQREDAAWEEVIALIEEKKAQPYDQATKLLVDLRDLAARRQQQATFQARLDKIVGTYANRSALLRRLRAAGLA